MKITGVRAVLLSSPIPEARRWRNDYGVIVKNDNVIVAVDTDEGVSGMGAAHGDPLAIRAIVEGELREALIGEDPADTERLWEKMYNGSRFQPSLDRGYSMPGHGRRGVSLCAIAGVDTALWDIRGRVLGQPIYKLLGASRAKVRAYGSGGWATRERIKEELSGYVAKGFGAVKMRAEGRDGFSIQKAVDRVSAARDGIGPNVELMVDAHGSLDISTAIRLAKRMEEYDLAWFEEPISPDNHRGLAEVRNATTIPIATGERESTRFDFLSLLEKRAVDIVQPDVAIAGGFTEVRRIAALALAFGVRVAPHAWASGVLVAASIHVAMATPNCHIFEVSQAPNPLIFDLFEEPFDIKDGYVYAPNRPGLGFTLREDVASRFPYIEGPNYIY